MRERILPLKGTISIVSKPGQGTEISVRVPLEKSA
jgi:signal transduction histidine kinase